MRIHVYVRPNAALSVGSDKCGWATVDVSVDRMSDKQKTELAFYEAKPQDQHVYNYELAQRPPLGVPGPDSLAVDDLLAYLDRLADWREAERVKSKQQDAEAVAEFVAAARAYLDTEVDNDALSVRRAAASKRPQLTALRHKLDAATEDVVVGLQRAVGAKYDKLQQQVSDLNIARHAAEMKATDDWIEKYGSERLRRMRTEGLDITQPLEEEQTSWLSQKLPVGWLLCSDLPGHVQRDPRDATLAELRLLDNARVAVPLAYLQEFKFHHISSDQCVLRRPYGVIETELGPREVVFAVGVGLGVSTAADDDDDDDDDAESGSSGVSTSMDGARFGEVLSRIARAIVKHRNKPDSTDAAAASE